MKTIICLWGNAGIGKTSAIQAIYKKLNIEDNPPMSRFGDDFLAIVPFCNSKVGLASMGDPNSEQSNCLDILEQAGCEIIICASRTRGATVNAVEILAQTGNYKLIWMSPFSNGAAVNSITLRDALNEATANAVIDLIRKCLYH